MRIRFGKFTLDSDTRELLRGTEPVHLSPKAFQLLLTLVENRPKALSKTELHQRLWPDTFVVEANLANLVGEVRVALGESSRRPRFLRTVHRYGYAFREAQATSRREPSPSSPGPIYRLVWKGGRATLAEGENVLGRDTELPLCFESPTISRRHARIVVSADSVEVEDLGSKNGTFVRGRRIDAPVALADGDQIGIGPFQLKFRVLRPAGSTETQVRSRAS